MSTYEYYREELSGVEAELLDQRERDEQMAYSEWHEAGEDLVRGILEDAPFEFVYFN